MGHDPDEERLCRDVSAYSDAVAAGIGERELVHAPGMSELTPKALQVLDALLDLGPPALQELNQVRAGRVAAFAVVRPPGESLRG